MDPSDERSDRRDEGGAASGGEPGSGEGSPTIRTKIATTLREGASSAGLGRLKDFALPIMTLALLAVLLISFSTILLPFIFACILVYLMEPIVRRLSQRNGGWPGLPRWMAVIAVYLVFIGVLTTSLVLVVPRFVTEIVRFAETVPEVVQDFRKERLPDLNEDLQDYLRHYLPLEGSTADLTQPQTRVRQARLEAARTATAFGVARARVERAADLDVRWIVEDDGNEGAVGRYAVQAPKGSLPDSVAPTEAGAGWTYGISEEPALRLVPSARGGLEVFLTDGAVEVARTDAETWVVRRHTSDPIPIDDNGLAIDEMFNLERTVDEVIEGLVSTSRARLTSIIEVAQTLVLGIVGTFVAIVLTLMVAAFISIDLPRVMSFIRGFVPDAGRHGYDVLLTQLDRGLGGVVRGQLLICLVNGTLTYIGLMILGVKFSVLLAVVAGILSLIPVFGTIISTIPIVMIGLTDGLMTGVLALGWILLIHFVEANILNPKIIGSSAHIHPVIVIFALLAGESAYGLVGALLAVPTASILLTLFNFVRTKAWREPAPVSTAS